MAILKLIEKSAVVNNTLLINARIQVFENRDETLLEELPEANFSVMATELDAFVAVNSYALFGLAMRFFTFFNRWIDWFAWLASAITRDLRVRLNTNDIIAIISITIESGGIDGVSNSNSRLVGTGR